jgi:hypothetical protein
MSLERQAELALALAGGAFAAAAVATCFPVIAWLRRIRYVTHKWSAGAWPDRMVRLTFVSGLLGACGLFLCMVIWIARLI